MCRLFFVLLGSLIILFSKTGICFSSSYDCVSFFKNYDFDTTTINYEQQNRLIIDDLNPIRISYIPSDLPRTSLWSVDLKTQDDILILFFNLIQKSKLKFKDSISTLMDISSHIRKLTQTDDTFSLPLSSWDIDKFIIELLGLGDFFNLVPQIVTQNGCEWLNLIKLWSKEEFEKTNQEFIELKKIISKYRLKLKYRIHRKDIRDFYFNPDQLNEFDSSLSSFTDIKFFYPLSKHLLGEIKHSNKLKNILTVIDDLHFFEISTFFTKDLNNMDLWFWTNYIYALQTKTLYCIQRAIKSTSLFISTLKEFQKNNTNFLKSNIPSILKASSTIISRLESLRSYINDLHLNTFDDSSQVSSKIVLDFMIHWLKKSPMYKYQLSTNPLGIIDPILDPLDDLLDSLYEIFKDKTENRKEKTRFFHFSTIKRTNHSYSTHVKQLGGYLSSEN